MNLPPQELTQPARLTIPGHPVSFEFIHKWTEGSSERPRILLAGWLYDSSFLVVPDILLVMIGDGRHEVYHGDLQAVWRVAYFDLSGSDDHMPRSRTRQAGPLWEAGFLGGGVCRDSELDGALLRQLWYANASTIQDLPESRLSRAKLIRLIGKDRTEMFRYTLPCVDGGAHVYETLPRGQAALCKWIRAGKPVPLPPG